MEAFKMILGERKGKKRNGEDLHSKSTLKARRECNFIRLNTLGLMSTGDVKFSNNEKLLYVSHLFYWWFYFHIP